MDRESSGRIVVREAHMWLAQKKDTDEGSQEGCLSKQGKEVSHEGCLENKRSEIICHLFCVCSIFSSIQFSSVAQWCPTLCDPMNCSTPGLPVHHQLLEFTQTDVHRVRDAIQPSHPLSSPSPPAPNPSHHQSLFQWVNSSHEVDKVLEFQL